MKPNPKRKTAPYYGRIRQEGRTTVVPLYTEDKSVATHWLEIQRNVLFQVNQYIEAGEPVPEDLRMKLVTARTPVFAQERPSEPVSVPGGLLERWEVDMRVRGMRSTTVNNYMRSARYLLGNLSPETLRADTVKSIITSKVKLSNNTRRFYCNVLRSLFNFMDRHDLVKVLPHVRTEESDHVFWTEEQMFDIVTEVSSDTPARTEQYRLYYSVLAQTGCRNTEARLLKWKHISNGCIRFPAEATKGRKARTVPIPFSLEAELDVIRRDPEDEVFNLVSPNQSRRYKVLKRALVKLGLEGGMHCFRRSRAAILYRKTRDIKICAQLLGHDPSIALKVYQDEVGVEELRRAVFDE